jgi:hypothetical protein
MNKEEKVKVVEELKGQLNDYKSIYLTLCKLQNLGENVLILMLNYQS